MPWKGPHETHRLAISTCYCDVLLFLKELQLRSKFPNISATLEPKRQSLLTQKVHTQQRVWFGKLCHSSLLCCMLISCEWLWLTTAGDPEPTKTLIKPSQPRESLWSSTDLKKLLTDSKSRTSLRAISKQLWSQNQLCRSSTPKVPAHSDWSPSWTSNAATSQKVLRNRRRKVTKSSVSWTCLRSCKRVNTLFTEKSWKMSRHAISAS